MTAEPFLTIAGRRIAPSEPPFMIAELSGNHNGSLDRALALVDAAKEAGADAVKLQTYTADTITIQHDGPGFRIDGGPWSGRTLHDLYQEASTPWEWHKALFQRARELGLIAFSAPFDETAVDFLESQDVPAYKIASFEVIDLPLIRRVASTGKPLILSTGMANLGEISAAVETALEAGASSLALLHCVSGYPTPIADSNLRTLPHLAQTFGVAAGLSDHTPGTAAAVASVALGGCIIEKHLTLRRVDGGPDAAFSLEPEEFTALAHDCRAAWEALGTISYAMKGSERGNVQFRRSLYIVRDVEAGEPLTADAVRSIRPGFGLAPRHLETVLGRRARHALTRGTPLAWTDID